MVYLYVSLTMLVIKCWSCVEADVTTCHLEKEEDTCTEKVFVASFSFSYFFYSHFLSLLQKEAAV